MLEYRKASQSDIDRLVALRIKQLIDEGYPETRDIHQDLRCYFSESLENGSLICWVGLDNDVIVATAGICFYQLPPSFSNPSGRVAYITNMYTADAYRRRGVAFYLLGLLIDEAKKLEYTSVRLHASKYGKSVYQKAGFTDAEDYMSMRIK